MKPPAVSYLDIGPSLTLTFFCLILLILGGNGMLLWQFHLARVQTDRLTIVSEQLVELLRLQDSLLSFHQRLDQLAQAEDTGRLASETARLRHNLLEQSAQTRSALAHMASGSLVDPALVPTLEAIEVTLPSQLDAITALATSGDWGAVRLRVSNELKPMEAQTSALVTAIDEEVRAELTGSVVNMGAVQRRTFLIVPATALATFCIAVFFGWAIARRIWDLRLEERVSERLRIARELHDTLLQSFQGVLLKFHTLAYLLPDGATEARTMLEGALKQATEAIAEGREAVQGLRSSVIPDDLARSIRSLGEGLAAELCGGRPCDFRVEVIGVSRNLAPLVRDEAYRVAGEALRNAFRHAQPKRVEAEIHYDRRQLRLRVRDDGKGIAPEVLAEGGRAGHHGLRGLHERAKVVGGKLAVRSGPGSGTEVELTIPAAIAYAKSAVGTPADFGART